MRQLPEVMLASIELFCLCAESANFSLAAQRAGLSPPAVSRAISRLESRLGVKLFVRTTRKVSLTEAGQRYFEQCRKAIGQIVEVEREITGQQTSPSGVVRLSVPTPFGQILLLPHLAAFRERYPAIQLHVHMGNRNVDFVADGFDLVIRMRLPPESELIARRLLDAELVVVASPRYLRKHGTPRQLSQLEAHECIQFMLPRTGMPVPWSFIDNGAPVELHTRGSFSVAEDPLGCVALARHHGGLLQTCRFMVEADLQQGTLKEVLKPFSGQTRPVSLLYPRDRALPLRVKLLIDFLVERFAGQR